MTKILYIPEARYVEFIKKGSTTIRTSILEESNYYAPSKIIVYCLTSGFYTVLKKFNNLPRTPLEDNEFEIIYD